MEKQSIYKIDQLQLLQKVGEGSFGEVFKVKKKETGEIFAAKISLTIIYEEEEIDEIKDDDATKKHNHSLIRNLVREVNILSKLNHPCIIKFIGFSPVSFNGEKKPVIITDFFPNGTLKDLIKLEQKGLSHEKWNDTR